MNIGKRQELFKNPTNEFRGKPFWSWNGMLDEEELVRQIDVMKKMGFGGYFMHSRTGLATEYLGEEWFELINKCADYGQKAGMESWLYDEDRWPSGSAGGMVTREEKYRAMYIEMNMLAPAEWDEYCADENTVAVFGCDVKDGVYSRRRHLAKGDRLDSGETAVEFRTRYSACSENYNGYSYVNTMDREAIEKYLETTHEKYREKCGDRLGREILGIFTDEPHRGGTFTNFAEGAVNAAPYTPGMFEEFEKRFGYSLKDELPGLFLRAQEGELSRVKRDYYELCQELFIECFAKPVYDWCRRNNLIFTGHVLHEDSLCAQSIMQGSLMRFYEYMEYPGVDVLAETNECYWVAKQIESVARQLDKKWVLSELYGCTGWQMNFESYKNIGDWQALLGVNLRSPHLSWYTMKGEAKRDYPASILHQSPWHEDFGYVEDYFSRIHVALHGGKPKCELLVINPIESVWARAYSGAFDGLNAADPEIKRLEEQYVTVFHALMGSQIDFDYGDEDIIARHGRCENGALYVGNAAYKKVLVAGIDTMRGTTLELLKKFRAQGGEVIFAGNAPAYVDAAASEAACAFAESCVRADFTAEAIARACRSGCEVAVVSAGREKIFSQVYEVDGGRVIMLLNTDRKNGYNGVELNLGRGESLEFWDARSGSVATPAFSVENGEIVLRIDIEKGGERIYMIPDAPRGIAPEKIFHGSCDAELPDEFRYTLTERNVYVLDMATLEDDSGFALPRMEALKADRALREDIGLSYRGGEALQPWYQIKYKGGNTELLRRVTLKYDFNVITVPDKIALVMEGMEDVRSVKVNGCALSLESRGRWLDICFSELEIPSGIVTEGKNIVAVEMDYYRTGGIEAAYLLGDFGVEVNGAQASITALPEKLKIGDITGQGLAFYSGSIVYHMDGFDGRRACVTAEDFGGSLVKLHGREDAVIAFPPYSAEADDLSAIEVVLTRRNTFGPLHERPKRAYAYGPTNFITEGESWTDDYMLYEQGLLSKPKIRV